MRTRGYVIRREFDLSEGDPYNRTMVSQAKRRLEGLGFFDRVNITTRPGSSPDRVVLVVNVAEKSTGEISFGGGYSTETGPLGTIELKERNFLGRGQFLKVSAGFGEESQKYELSFTEPYFLGNRLAAGFDISQTTASSRDNVPYDIENTLVRLRVAAPITNNLRLQANYTWQQERYDGIDLSGPDCTAPGNSVSLAICNSLTNGAYNISSVGYKLTYSSLDSLRSPREGIYAELQQDFAGLGGDAEYVKTTAKATGYYLVSEDADVVAVGSLGAGHVWSWGNDLRVQDHFRLGGETVRGFDTRGFGPRDLVTDDAVGGTTYLKATAELQFPIGVLPRSYGVRGALFADVGTLFDNEFKGLAGTDIDDAASIRASVGASILWDSPFGPLRADFAYPVAKESFDDEQFFRFGVSTKF